MMRATIGFGTVLLFLGAAGPTHAAEPMQSILSMTWSHEVLPTITCSWSFSGMGTEFSTSRSAGVPVSDSTSLTCTDNVGSTYYDMSATVTWVTGAVPFEGRITMVDEGLNEVEWYQEGDKGVTRAFGYQPMSAAGSNSFETILNWWIYTLVDHPPAKYDFVGELTVTEHIP